MAVRDVLRRRRRPVDHPGPQGRGHRLRQPGPRPRAVACATPASRSASACRRAPRAARRPRSRACGSLTPAEASAKADVIMLLAPDTAQADIFTNDDRAEPRRRQRAVLRSRPQHPLRPDQAAGQRRRRHGRPEGPGPPGAPPVRRRQGRAVPDRRRAGPQGRGRRRSRCPTPRASAAPAPASSRPRSRRRPRPTCSASRPCCAAAPRNWSRPASR